MFENSDFNESIVVSVPAPATNGNAIGTIDPEAPSSLRSRKNWIPNIISRPIKKIIKDPASANEEISIPNKPRMADPKNKNRSMIAPAVSVAVAG